MINAFAQFKVSSRYEIKKKKMNSCGYGQRLKFKFVSVNTQKPSHGIPPNLLGESYI